MPRDKNVFFLAIFLIFLSALFFTYTTPVFSNGAGGFKNETVVVQKSKGKWYIPDFGQTFKDLFFGIVQVIAYLISLAVSLIEWALSPSFMDLIRQNQGIYAGWRTVRDVLNMFFIFFLLYSAFCTVFQISRYHIRNTWVMIVVMALLVNFSWPIARVLIDLSNVTMEWMMNSTGTTGGNLTTGSGLMSTIGNDTKFAEILVGGVQPGKAPDSWTNIFMGIITGLLFLVVVMTVALILLIRVVALAILLVFASAGFTMAAFPMTSSYAHKWWGQFVKYLAAGPILLFVLILSVSILQGMGSQFVAGATEAAKKSGIVENVMIYVISLIILWTGIMTVGSLGDGASSAVLGMAGKARGKLQGLAKSGTVGMAKFVDRQAGQAVNRMANTEGSGVGSKLARGTGQRLAAVRSIPKRIENYRTKQREKYEDVMSETVAHGVSYEMGLPGDDKNAIRALENKKVADMKKKYKDDNVDLETLMTKMQSPESAVEQRALAEFLSEHKDFGKGSNDEQYAEIQKILARRTDASNRLPDNIRTALEKKLIDEGKAHIVLRSRLQSGQYQDSRDAYQHMFEKMSGVNLGKQDGLMRELQNSNETVNVEIRQMIRERVQGNARLAQQIRDNASGQYMSHATGANGILT